MCTYTDTYTYANEHHTGIKMHRHIQTSIHLHYKSPDMHREICTHSSVLTYIAIRKVKYIYMYRYAYDSLVRCTLVPFPMKIYKILKNTWIKEFFFLKWKNKESNEKLYKQAFRKKKKTERKIFVYVFNTIAASI